MQNHPQHQVQLFLLTRHCLLELCNIIQVALCKECICTYSIKISGLRNNQTFVEFGGTLQQQQRTYFGR